MILLSHLLPAGFTQPVALALHETGLLARFCTTLTPSGRDPLAALLRVTGTGSQRTVNGVPRELLVTYPWREAVRLAAGRLGVDARQGDELFHWARNGFDRWVSRQLHPGITGVYGYETECLETFRRARERGMTAFYDLPSPEHEFVENLIQEEIEAFPELNTPDRRYLRERQAERTERRREEFALANLALANSNFTRDTWVQAGMPKEKIAVLPYGAPAPDISGADGGSRGAGPLRLLWAGTFSIRKGAHLLVDAWRRSATAGSMQLDVFGTLALPHEMLARLPDSVRLHGPVPHAVVIDAYRAADALVFPTLCDGFGLVVNEALSRGLPVITTHRAGASDLITHNHDGLLIEHGSVESIEAALAWCIAHRDTLRDMRAAALETAAKWQWSDYRQRLVEIIKPVLSGTLPGFR